MTTLVDFRAAVKAAYLDSDLKRLSLRELGKRIGCSHEKVRRVREELLAAGEIELPRSIEGADGKEYAADKKPRQRLPDYVQSDAPSEGDAEAVFEPPTLQQRKDEANRGLFFWAGRVRIAAREFPSTPWANETEREAIVGLLRKAADLADGLRPAGAHRDCDGDGCSGCRGTGYLTRNAAR